MAIERIIVNYHGVPSEVVYSPGVKEVVFTVNPEILPLEPFMYGHKTFTGISPENWCQLKVRLTSGCTRPHKQGFLPRKAFNHSFGGGA